MAPPWPTRRLYRHLQAAVGDFEVEISVDETESPTTYAQHVYIATELRRLGVRWLAWPRHVGRFEKGVDYMGDVAGFEKDIEITPPSPAPSRPTGRTSSACTRDRTSLRLPRLRKSDRGLAHLKTAGTSYLEALRTVAVLDPKLFRDIYDFSCTRYEEDRASYHVSANWSRRSSPRVPDEELPALLERFEEREILHVTFGSVLREATATASWGCWASIPITTPPVSKAFLRHLEPFANGGSR